MARERNQPVNISQISSRCIFATVLSTALLLGALKGGAQDGTAAPPDATAESSIAPPQTRAEFEDTISLANIERLAIVGDSITNGGGKRGKHAVCIASMLSDWNICNCGISGQTYITLNNTIRGNRPFPCGLSFAEAMPRYAILVSQHNDYRYWQVNPNNYYRSLERLILLVQSHGTQPILATEQLNYEWQHGLGISHLARKHNLDFLGINAEMRRTVTPFQTRVYLPALDKSLSFAWNGCHPQSRALYHFGDVYVRFLRHFYRPRKAIKVFRRRATTTVPPEALIHNDLYERARRWLEIDLAHNENANTYPDFTGNDHAETKAKWAPVKDEYTQLFRKQPVPFNDVALIEVVVPRVAVARARLRIASDRATGLTCAVLRRGADAGLPQNQISQELLVGLRLRDAAEFAKVKTMMAKGVKTFRTTAKDLPETLTVDHLVPADRVARTTAPQTSYRRCSTIGAFLYDAELLNAPETDDARAYLSPQASFAYADSLHDYLRRQIGAWIPMKGAGDEGRWTFTVPDPELSATYDKFSFLIQADGPFHLSDIQLDISGGREKTNERHASSAEFAGKQLFEKTTFDDLPPTGWQVVGSPRLRDDSNVEEQQYSATTDKTRPPGADRVLLIREGCGVRTEVTFAEKTSRARSCRLVAWCRRFPPVNDGSDETGISYRSFDLTRVRIAVNDVSAPGDPGDTEMTEYVGLAWKRCIFEFTAPPGCSGLRLTVTGDEPREFELGKVEFLLGE